jgi:hypothetical protein
MAENVKGAWEQEYGVVRRRVRDEGILVIPVAGPAGTPPKIVRVHGGLEMETVDFNSGKFGAPPTVPSPASLNSNLQFVSGNQAATLPMAQPQQGVHYWTLSGQYLYVHIKPTGLTSAFSTGIMPFEIGTAVNNTIPASAFSQQILGSDSPPPLQLGTPIQGP